MTKDTPAHFAQRTDHAHREICNTFATVAFCSHHPMPIWTFCSCLLYLTTQFFSVASHIKYIYITLYVTSTFLPCSAFFSFHICVGDEGVALREGGTWGSVGGSRACGPCLVLFGLVHTHSVWLSCS